MDQLSEFLAQSYWGNTAQSYLLAAGFFLALLLFFLVFKSVLVSKLVKWAEKTGVRWDDKVFGLMARITPFFYFVISAYVPLRSLQLNPTFSFILNAVFVVVVVYQVVRLVLTLVEYTLDSMAQKRGGKQESMKTTFYGLMLVVKMVVWTIAFLLVLSNLGVNITSLIASLSIGGLAVAFAVQNILGDIFNSFSIYFDKPFVVGDYIEMSNGDGGTVKKIGLKTTRLETLQGEELVVSNNELTTVRVKNFKRMKKRRVVLHFGLVYKTKSKDLSKVNDLAKKVIDDIESVEFNRTHFKEFGPHSLNFEVVYYVLSKEYLDYMDCQQEVNIALKAAFEKAKFEMAFPTQTVHLEK